MEDENIYNDIQKIFEDLPDNFNILEEQIDLEIQMQYFEFSKKVREEGAETDYLECADELFVPETGIVCIYYCCHSYWISALENV